ncbi:MAG: cysteine desulfurase family protein [Eubacterium sp.]
MEAYLDNAATTKVFPEVAELVAKVMCEDYGNPSSLHGKGVDAEQYIREAADAIAATLKCKRKNIIFTSGGTESNNQALIGVALANKRQGKHIITTCFEHAAVYEPCLYLEQQFGFEVTYLPVDSMGHISSEEIKNALRPDTILVSTMMVNNEVGAILDIRQIGKMIKEYNPSIIYHVDAIQAYGKMKIQPLKLKIDLLSVSGHKIHGPKGSGFLYVADGVKMHPIIHGGGQQNGRRSGTQNVPGIAGLGLAVKKMYEDHLAKVSRMYALKEHLIEKLKEIDNVTIHAVTPEIRECAPHVVSASFEGVGSEVLLHALEDRGVYVSSGSACSSNHPGISSTLQAIGVSDKLLESTIRFSFSVYTTVEELDYTVEQLKELLPVLRRYVRR